MEVDLRSRRSWLSWQFATSASDAFIYQGESRLTMMNPTRNPPSAPRQTMLSAQSTSASQPGSNANKSADYVFFERTTTSFSDAAIPRAKTAQLKLEHYYKVAVDAAIERNTRCVLDVCDSMKNRSIRLLFLFWQTCWTWAPTYEWCTHTRGS